MCVGGWMDKRGMGGVRGGSTGSSRSSVMTSKLAFQRLF